MSVLRKLLSPHHVQGKHAIYAASLLKKNYCNFILKSDLPDVEIPDVSLDEFVFSKTDKWPRHIATECAVTGRRYTYEEVRNKATNLSRNLRRKLKLQKGDVMAILMPNVPEFVVVALGVIKAGLVLTSLNPVYTPDEISRQLIDSSAKAIITLSELHSLAKASTEKTKTILNILTINTQSGQSTPEGAINFTEFIQPTNFPDLPPADSSDLAFLPYSSGTTGLPKGVELTHRNITANLCQIIADKVSTVKETTSEHQDVVPALLPSFHIYGFTINTLHMFLQGSKAVTLPKFTPETYVDMLRRHKPHVLFVAPPLVHFLTGSPLVTGKDFASVRSLTSGAAPLGSLDEERFLHKAQKHINVFQGYGLSETSPLVSVSRVDVTTSTKGNIGRPVPLTAVKIVDLNDPTNTPLGPHQKGELLVKGPQVMRGYHKKPKETQECLTKDGWFKTGDIGYYDDDHILFIADRMKELIKVKGFQVPPAELEEIVRDFPGVTDAAVIGIPHESSGELPRAYVVQKAGQILDKQKLEAFVAEKVAPYKRLKGGIEIVDSIPKNSTGKILRRALKDQFQGRQKQLV